MSNHILNVEKIGELGGLGGGLGLGDIKDILSQLLQNLPPELASGVGTLITILQAVGIVFLIYFIILIVGAVLNIRRSLRIKRIDIKVQEIDEKLDKLLHKKHSKEHKEETKEDDKGKHKKSHSESKKKSK